jgi:ankyrin repeat protein
MRQHGIVGGGAVFFVERNPATLEVADQNGLSPLHLACQAQQALFEVGVQFLVQWNPTTLKTAEASLAVVQFLAARHPTTLEMSDCYGKLPLHKACRKQTSFEVV